MNEQMETTKTSEKQNGNASKLAVITKDVERRLMDIAKSMEQHKAVMLEDYERFFRWHSEEAYKAQVYKQEYDRLLIYLGTGDMNEIREYLCRKIKKTTASFMESNLREFSMSASALANINELEAKRTLCEYYKMMLDFIGNENEEELNGQGI